MPANTRFIVRRPSQDEVTFAEVKVVFTPKALDENLDNDGIFLPLLRQAVTHWVKTTDEGKAEWNASSKDFNVGDLSNISNKSLRVINEYLKPHGVQLDEVNIISESELCYMWTYDTVLVNPDQL